MSYYTAAELYNALTEAVAEGADLTKIPLKILLSDGLGNDEDFYTENFVDHIDLDETGIYFS